MCSNKKTVVPLQFIICGYVYVQCRTIFTEKMVLSSSSCMTKILWQATPEGMLYRLWFKANQEVMLHRYGLVPSAAESGDEGSGSYATAHSSLSSLNDACKICHCGSEVKYRFLHFSKINSKYPPPPKKKKKKKKNFIFCLKIKLIWWKKWYYWNYTLGGGGGGWNELLLRKSYI